jgi:serine/threonine protein kinase
MVGLPHATVLSDYVIDRVLGAGGFGITYLAFHNLTGDPVAIKEYFPRSAAVRDDSGQVWISEPKNEELFNRGLKGFWDEAETLARFRHPHIVKVQKRLLANGTAYIILEYVEGISLEQWAIEARARPTQDQLDAFIVALLDALETIHRAQFLHRDIAPKNILLLQDGMPILIDFGAARALDPSRDMTTILTPGYAPYEQYPPPSQKQGPWTDIYSLAASIYRVLTKRPPADAVTRKITNDTQFVPLMGQFRGEYRRQFLEGLDWALQFDPVDRPQNVTAWRNALFDGATQWSRWRRG